MFFLLKGLIKLRDDSIKKIKLSKSKFLLASYCEKYLISLINLTIHIIIIIIYSINPFGMLHKTLSIYSNNYHKNI